MPATYESIATTTLTTGQTSVSFSSISGSFTDLILVATIQGTTSNDAVILQVNDDTATNYSRTAMYGLTGNVAGSARQSSQTYIMVGDYTPSATNFGLLTCHFQNYSNTTTNKTILNRFGNSDQFTWAGVGLWRSTAAINKITIKMLGGNNIKTDSVFTLYGIKAA